MIRFLYRLFRKVWKLVGQVCSRKVTKFLFYVNGVDCRSDFFTNGVPVVRLTQKGIMKVGAGFRMNNGLHHNIIGRQQRCYFVVSGNLEIGNNVGMSATAIVCMQRIKIGDGVRIGGNTVIYDTDFHSLDSVERLRPVEDKSKVGTKPVVIKKNVFIGAHSTILKGVTIGENSIIGAGSLVCKDIPPNQIWAGNPVKFIRSI